MQATLTSKGQITVPAKYRALFNLHAGDKLDFEFKDDYLKLVPLKKGSLDDFINILPKATRSHTVEEMNEAIAEGACDGGY